MIPEHMELKQLACGFVELAWIGSNEVILEADLGTGALILTAFDHSTGHRLEHVVFTSARRAERAFYRACKQVAA